MPHLIRILVMLALVSFTASTPYGAVHADDSETSAEDIAVQAPPAWDHGVGIGLFAAAFVSSGLMIALTAQLGSRSLEDEGKTVEASFLSVFGLLGAGPAAAAGSVYAFGELAGYRGGFWAAFLGAEVGVWFGLGFTTLILWSNDQIEIRNLRSGDALLLVTVAPALTASASALIGYILSRDANAEMRASTSHASPLHYSTQTGWVWSLPSLAAVPTRHGVDVYVPPVEGRF